MIYKAFILYSKCIFKVPKIQVQVGPTACHVFHPKVHKTLYHFSFTHAVEIFTIHCPYRLTVACKRMNDINIIYIITVNMQFNSNAYFIHSFFLFWIRFENCHWIKHQIDFIVVGQRFHCPIENLCLYWTVSLSFFLTINGFFDIIEAESYFYIYSNRLFIRTI